MYIIFFLQPHIKITVLNYHIYTLYKVPYTLSQQNEVSNVKKFRLKIRNFVKI